MNQVLSLTDTLCHTPTATDLQPTISKTKMASVSGWTAIINHLRRLVLSKPPMEAYSNPKYSSIPNAHDVSATIDLFGSTFTEYVGVRSPNPDRMARLLLLLQLLLTTAMLSIINKANRKPWSQPTFPLPYKFYSPHSKHLETNVLVLKPSLRAIRSYPTHGNHETTMKHPAYKHRLYIDPTS